RPMVGEFADVLEVLGYTADEVAGLLLVVVAERQLLQMVERLPPHVGLDVDAEHVAPVGDHEGKEGVEQVDERQADGGEGDYPPLPAGQQLIDEHLHGDREAQLEDAEYYRRGEIEYEQAPIGRVISEEPLQHRAMVLG